MSWWTDMRPINWNSKKVRRAFEPPLCSVLEAWLPLTFREKPCFRVLSIKQKLHLIGKLHCRRQTEENYLRCLVMTQFKCDIECALPSPLNPCLMTNHPVSSRTVSKPGVLGASQCLFPYFMCFCHYLQPSCSFFILLHAEHSWTLIIYFSWDEEG